MALYGGTAAVAAVPLLRSQRGLRVRRATAVLAVLAAAAHFVALLVFAAVYRVLPLVGLGPTLATLAFMVALLGVGLLLQTREPAVMLVTVPLAVGPLGLAVVAGFEAPSAGASSGAWFLLHAAASLFGLALLGVAVGAAALYLGQHRVLKERQFGVIFQFFPPLEQLDRLNLRALVVGFPILTVGIALAVVFAGRALEPVATLRYHVGWGFFAWAVFGGLALARAKGWLWGRAAARVSLLGFGMIAGTFLVLRLAFGSLRFL